MVCQRILALCSTDGSPLSTTLLRDCIDVTEAASEAELLINFRYEAHPNTVCRFRRTALIDIDPGLTQLWMARGQIEVARHDVYWSIGETVGTEHARFPSGGCDWQYTPPCVALDWWPVVEAPSDAAFTTISHWTAHEWIVDDAGFYKNCKRSGFEPYLGLTDRTTETLELALCLGNGEIDERSRLKELGWRVVDSWAVSAHPWDYQRYIQTSRGEFSCAKPSCIRLQNAWISDRTLCYLASGKPAMVQDTGPSKILPSRAGLCRFSSLEQAAEMLDDVSRNYETHCSLARSLVEERFDAKRVLRLFLERSL